MDAQPAGAELDEEQTARFQGRPPPGSGSRRGGRPRARSAVRPVVGAERTDTRARRLAQLISDSAAGRRVPPLVPR